jgi:DNA-binding SARP family transcriptional activator
MRFGLLGSLQVISETDQLVAVPAAKQRVILAALLLSADKIVPVDQLADALWGTSGPPNAAATVRTYVMRLRRVLGQPGARITGQPPGYLVEVRSPVEFDVAEVGLLRSAALGAAEAGEWDQVSGLLRSALSMWRGVPLVDVPSDALYRSELPRLAELRLQLIETRVDADLRLGRSGEMVAELQGLVAQHPLREHFAAQLMLACYRSGRQGDSLQVYRDVRTALVRELGLEPGPELREMHGRILDADAKLLFIRSSPAPTWLASAARSAVPPAAASGHKVPRQLPALMSAAREPNQGGSAPAFVPRQLPTAVKQFAGRQAELAALTGLLDRAGEAAGAVVIGALGGMAGVGKTALAVRWAHQIAGRFPDGQLYVNLRGFDPSGRPMPPAEALRGLLDALMVPAGRIPASVDAQAGLYRSLLSGKRMLVVLDNARDAGQIRPLLPASPGCLVVVTSRSQLAGLVAAEGACALTLGLLTEAEARELLALRLGQARLDAEPAAAAQLTGLCAGLPLALAIAAARVSARPGFGLGALAEELKDAQRMLDALDTGDAPASVRAVFSWSLNNLPAPAARMFALLGLHPGPDITTPAAASLAAIPPLQAHRALVELAEAHLITEHTPGRFSLHDLLRAYAAEQAGANNDGAARNAAFARTLDHYLHAAHAAASLINPSREPVTLSAQRTGVTLEHLADHQQALGWFEAEHHVLLSAVTLADRAGFDACAWQLPLAIANYLDWRGYWHEWAVTQRTALAAATRLGDIAGQAVAHRQLAHACVRLADYDAARAHLTECLGLSRQLGDRDGEARAHQTLGGVAERQHRHDDALGHVKQALALYRATGSRAGQAAALNNVGWCHAQLGDHQQAHTYCRQALAMRRELGDRPGEAYSWDSLGYAEHKLGHLAEAADCYRRALGIFEELGGQYQQAGTLNNLGDTCRVAGQLDAARDAWQRALDILDELDHQDAHEVRAKLRQLELDSCRQ